MTDKERMNFAKKYQYFRKSPSAFVEYLYGTKLHWYQKFILDNIESLKSYPRKPIPKEMIEYENLSDYLCNCIRVSQPRNVCACAVDLAKYNDMTMGELFEKYEG